MKAKKWIIMFITLISIIAFSNFSKGYDYYITVLGYGNWHWTGGSDTFKKGAVCDYTVHYSGGWPDWVEVWCAVDQDPCWEIQYGNILYLWFRDGADCDTTLTYYSIVNYGK